MVEGRRWGGWGGVVGSMQWLEMMGLHANPFGVGVSVKRTAKVDCDAREIPG